MCFTLEDAFNEPKIKGKTRIPAGKYKVDWKSEPTPLTIKYRQRYDYFNWHLEVKDVPDFSHVYIHVGNSHKDTDGCILVGDSLTNQGTQSDFLGNSRQAFNRVYNKLASILNKGEKLTLTISDH
jgi:translation elongation factor EF-4